MRDFVAKFDKVDTADDAAWQSVLDLADEMPVPHSPDRRLDTIIISNSKTGEKLGYTQVIPWPVTVTSWKRPGVDTLMAIQQTKESFIQRGHRLTACPLDSKFFPHMERLGFTPSGLALFYPSEDS